MTRLFSVLALTGLLVGMVGTAMAAPDSGLDSATRVFQADFNVNKSGLPLGNTHFSLKRDDEKSQGSCFVYTGQANPNALVHLFLGDIDETSQFCVVDGMIRPQAFSHHENGKPKKSYTLVFDWDQKVARYHDEAGRTRRFDIQAGVQDPLSLQIAARAWVADALAERPATDSTPGQKSFRLVDDDGVEDFTLDARDGGRIQTDAGTFDTLRVARAGDHSHPLVLWLARDHDWIPVQVETGSHGNTFTMKATSLSLAGH